MVLDKWRKLTHLSVMKQFENLCGWKKKRKHIIITKLKIYKSKMPGKHFEHIAEPMW